ncbi:MAG: hypothetical protein GY719_27285 [bacterium]|nr:hypothetical protein [bacterium]
MGAETASTLLRIDFDAALDKLAWSQLQGAWELPAELARLAIRAGASAVELDIEPRRLVIEAPGARLGARTISDFASVLDRRLEPADRHRAMVDLEERDAFVLSAVACSNPRSLALTTAGERGLKLELAPDGRLSVVNPAAAVPDQADLRLEIDGLPIEAQRAKKWLRRVGRFAHVPITIDGARIDRGFHAPLIEKRLMIPAGLARSGVLAGSPPPLSATISIPRRGSAPRLWLLRHGIISTHATVPGYPAFEAAVEMAQVSSRPVEPQPAGHSASEANAAALRERLDPYVEGLVDAAVGLTIRLGRAGESLPEEARARTARLLLLAALKRRRLSEVSGVGIFPLVGPKGRRLVSIDVVGRLVRVEEGGVSALDAITPGQDPKRFSLAGHGALAISQGERALLGELLRVVFSNPPARARQRPWRRLLDRAVSLGSSLRFSPGAAVAESELSPLERSFLSRLRAATVDGNLPEVEFRTGGGRIHRSAGDRLLLPRDNPDVRACVRAVERDPVWLYPATIALMSGEELPGPGLAGPELRRLWYSALEA